MAKFPIQEARQTLGFNPATAVRANLDTRTADVGAAIGQGAVKLASQAIAIHKKRQQMTDSNSSSQANDIRDLADKNFEKFKLENSQDTWQAERTRLSEVATQQIGGLEFSERALNNELTKNQGYGKIADAQAFVDSTRQLQKETIIIQDQALENAYATNDPNKIKDQSNIFMKSMISQGMNKDIIKMKMAAHREGGKAKRVVTLASGGDFEEARALVGDTSFDDPKDRESILNTIRLMESKRFDLSAERDFANNKDFTVKILDKTADLPSEVAKSKLPDTSTDPDKIAKDDWNDWIDGSFTPNQDITTPAASGTIIDTVINRSKKRIGEEAALKTVLETMYGDRELTDADYAWAIDKLQNPYPAKIASDLGRITEENKSTARHWYTSNRYDVARVQKVNSGLIAYVDSELKADRIPDYDEMYTVSAQLMASSDEARPRGEPSTKTVTDPNLPELTIEQLLKKITK